MFTVITASTVIASTPDEQPDHGPGRPDSYIDAPWYLARMDVLPDMPLSHFCCCSATTTQPPPYLNLHICPAGLLPPARLKILTSRSYSTFTT